MDKLISWLEGSFAPKMNKVVENPWILTIKNSVMQALPLIFLGSIFSLLTIPENYLDWWPNFWTSYGWTFGIVSLIVAFLIPYNLLMHKGHKRAAINGGIAGVILFLISLNPPVRGRRGFHDRVRQGGMGADLEHRRLRCRRHVPRNHRRSGRCSGAQQVR